ncbi:hypothetical protein JCM10212_000238 [Sporobolomyces blumeae]
MFPSASTEPSQLLPPPPAPIRYFDLLPTELVQQILEHIEPIEYAYFETYRRRQADLRAVCLTSRRLHSLALPLLFAVRLVVLKPQRTTTRTITEHDNCWLDTKVCVVWGSGGAPPYDVGNFDPLFQQMPSLTQLRLFSGAWCIHGSIKLKSDLSGDARINYRLDGPIPLPSLVALKCSSSNNVELDVAGWPAAFPSLRVLSLCVFSLSRADNFVADQHFDRLMQQIDCLKIGLTRLTGSRLERLGEKTLVVVDTHGLLDWRGVARFLLKWTGLPPLFENVSNCCPFELLSNFIASSSTSQPALRPVLFLPSSLRKSHYHQRQACNCSRKDYPAFKEIDIIWENERYDSDPVEPRLWADDLRERIETRRAVLGRIDPADGPAMA